MCEPIFGPTTREEPCYALVVLPPTSARLLDSEAVPYFLWDTQQTVVAMQRILASPACSERDEILVRLLREANSRDVWHFATWEQIDEAWPRIVGRLGRARPVWEMLRERHLYHVNQTS
jgi:hypothetical protein